MGAAYNRDTCGYFDNTSKHGGPDPNPHLRPDGKPRTRRFAAEDLQEDLEAECEKGLANISDTVAGECCDYVESFSSDNEAFCLKGVRARGSKKDPWDRLSDDNSLKWKQIMTGCRKWAERYIGNCHGQRKNQLIKKRTKKVYAKVSARLNL